MFNLIELVNILGYPMMNETAAAVLKKNGFEPGYRETTLKGEGSVFLGTRASGIELSFGKRSDYEEDFAKAKAAGEAIFTAIFIEPAYITDYKNFVIPESMRFQNCKNRNDALKLLGKPERTSEDEGVFEWDRWIIAPELAIRSDYKNDQSIYMWTIGPPMKL